MQKSQEQFKKDVGEAKKGLKQVAADLAEKFNWPLGKAPNAIPPDKPNQNSARRNVYVGSHPLVGPDAIKALAVVGNVLIGRVPVAPSIRESKGVPDPMHHWAVIVGDYFHELNADKNFDVVYQNGKVKWAEWKLHEV